MANLTDLLERQNKVNDYWKSHSYEEYVAEYIRKIEFANKVAASVDLRFKGD